MAKVNLEITGKDKGASTAVKGVTKSLITASLAVEGIKIATKALINVGKQSIESLRVQEQILAKLEVQTGGNTEAIEKWTSEIQNATTIGDEAQQQIASLGLSMGITEDKLEDATKGAIGLSEALGLDLNGAMKMVALSNEGEYNMLARYIPALKSATSEAEKQAIVQEAMAKGFDLAKAKAETFTGKLEQLDNIQGDNLESFGKIVSIVGKDFVNSMVKGATSINDFLSDADRVASIGASFKVLGEVSKELGSATFKELQDILGDLADDFNDIVGEGDKTQMIFTVIAGATKGLSIGLGIVLKLAGLIIKPFINIIKVGKDVIKVFTSVWDVIKGKADAKDVLDNLKNVGNAYKDGYMDILSGVKDLVTETASEFKNFNTETGNNAQRYADIWAKTNKEIKDDFNNTKEDVISDPLGKKVVENDEPELKTWSSSWKKATDTIQGLYTETGSSAANFSASVFNSFNDAFTSIGAIVSNSESTVGDKIAGIMETALEVTSSILGQIQEMWNDHYESLLEQNDAWSESQTEKADAWAEAEMERQGVAVASKQESLQTEINDLNSAIALESDAEAKADLQSQLKEKKDELARAKILEEAEKKKEKIQRKAADKELALKKQQFEDNKKMSIANIWINAATSVIGWWSAFASMGIPGIVLAGVMTAATLAMAGVQTGIVASQTFAEGGVVSGSSYAGDNVNIRANSGERILTAEQNKAFEDMVYNGSGGGFNNYGSITVVANNPEEFQNQLIEIERFEGVR